MTEHDSKIGSTHGSFYIPVVDDVGDKGGTVHEVSSVPMIKPHGDSLTKLNDDY